MISRRARFRLWSLRLAFAISVCVASAVVLTPVWAPKSNDTLVMLGAFSSGWAVMVFGRRLWYWRG